MTLNELISLLNEIISDQNCSSKKNKISLFQNIIWEDKEEVKNEVINSILSELAIILDNYEPNYEWRKESNIYFGDEELKEKIQNSLKKIEILKNEN